MVSNAIFPGCGLQTSLMLILYVVQSFSPTFLKQKGPMQYVSLLAQKCNIFGLESGFNSFPFPHNI